MSVKMGKGLLKTLLPYVFQKHETICPHPAVHLETSQGLLQKNPETLAHCDRLLCSNPSLSPEQIQSHCTSCHHKKRLSQSSILKAFSSLSKGAQKTLPTESMCICMYTWMSNCFQKAVSQGSVC